MYFTVTVNDRTAVNGVWSYPNPIPDAEPVRDYLAFYPGRMDACFVDDKRVTTQGSEYYGGWVTSGVVGQFKKRPGEK